MEGKKDKVIINLEECTGCGKCVSLCPANALEMRAGGAFLAHPELCTQCGICEDQCPSDAISLGEDAVSLSKVQTIMEPPMPLPQLRQWTEEIVEALELQKPPLGVKMLAPGESPPEGFNELDASMRHCVSLHVASFRLALSVPARRHACAAAKAAFGMAELPEKVRSGKVPYMHGLASSERAAARTMEEIPHLPLGSCSGTLVAPLSMFPFLPDVVILVANPKQAMWVANAMIYHEGGPRIQASFAGMQASCADVTAIPFKTQQVNFSLGCYGCRSAGKLGDEEIYVGIPMAKVKSIVTGLKGLRRAMGKLERAATLGAPVQADRD